MSSQGCPRHASNAGCNRWMKLPGSQWGFSSRPAVTRIASSISSLKLRPPYQGVHSSPGCLGPLPRELGTLPQYRSVACGKERASIEASELRWLEQLLTTCPPKQWSLFRTWPNFHPYQLHRKNTVGFPGGACTTADTRWAAGWGRHIVKAVLPHVLWGWAKGIGILCHSYPENYFLFLNTVKIEGGGGRDEHGCDFNMPIMSGNVCLA